MIDDEMKFEAEQMETFFGGGNKNAGQLVETKTGLIGRTYSHEGLVNGKVRVYLMMCHICGGEGAHTDDCGSTMLGWTKQGDRKLLCDPATLKLKGFID